MSKITFLSSGNGGNLKFLYLMKSELHLSNIELSVVADRECGATLFAQKHGIECIIVKVKQDEQIELIDAISCLNPQIIFTTIHRVISPNVLQIYGDRMMNLHYSLLPRYSGLIGMRSVEDAIKNRDTFLGVTIHKVTSSLDAGPTIVQSYFQNPNDYALAAKACFRLGCLQIWSTFQEIECSGKDFTNKTEELLENFVFYHSQFIPNFPSIVNESFWFRVSKL
jgi:phosphoribosylglycinamide formyltransferase-1